MNRIHPLPLNRVDRAALYAGRELSYSGYRTIYCGMTARGGALVRWAKRGVLADRSFSVIGGRVWFGVDAESGVVFYYVEP